MGNLASRRSDYSEASRALHESDRGGPPSRRQGIALVKGASATTRPGGQLKPLQIPQPPRPGSGVSRRSQLQNQQSSIPVPKMQKAKQWE